jgi:hypothetical protein
MAAAFEEFNNRNSRLQATHNNLIELRKMRQKELSDVMLTWEAGAYTRTLFCST